MQKKDNNEFYLKPTAQIAHLKWEITEIDSCDSSEDAMSLKEIAALRLRERKKLLELYSLSTEDFNEMEHKLYFKHKFASKTLPDDKEKQYQILNMLLADRGALFTYGNDGYWNRQVNREIISEYNRLFRDKTLQSKLYEKLPALNQIDSDAERSLHIELLTKITETAAQKHQSLKNWVKRNIFYATPSAEERMALVKLIPEFQEADTVKFRKIITKIIPDSVCRVWLSNSPAYLKAEQNLELFQKMLPEHMEKIDRPFCRTFVNEVLPDYMQRVERAATLEYRPDHVPVDQQVRTMYSFLEYKFRLFQIKNAQRGYQQDLSSILELKDLQYFGMKSLKEEKSEPKFCRIEKAIVEFFQDFNAPLSEDTRGYLKQRIKWAVSISDIPQPMLPVFLLYMVVCCNRRLTHGDEIEIPKCARKPFYDERKGWPQQRYAQLLLLDKLCEIFSVTGDALVENWKQFLFWQGKNIASHEEYVFWNNQKEEKKRSIPDTIQFQLLCTEYLNKCFPLYLEQLLFTAGSDLHRGRFREFWDDNHSKLYEQAVWLGGSNVTLIKEYFDLWSSKNPKDLFFHREEWLDGALEVIKIDLDNFQKIPKCDHQELKRLILESELRIYICNNAHRKLAGLVQRIYGLSPKLFKTF